MSRTIIIFLLCLGSYGFGQDDGGMLCGGEDEKPLWLFRFEVIDEKTHLPVNRARIKTVDYDGREMSWYCNSKGVAVLVATNAYCLPEIGTLEIAADGYHYFSQSIEREYFDRNESEYRILMEGHRHQWVDMNRVPETQEIIDKISRRQYQVGVREFPSDFGFNWVNCAPPCFEYKVELQRLEGRQSTNRADDRRPRPDLGQVAEEPLIPTVMHDGRLLHVFPNDLSDGPYFWQQANDGCECLNRLGYTDWRLPTREELNALYRNRIEIGAFTDGWYWSSSAGSYRDYWAQDFEDGDQDTEFKGTSYEVHKRGMRVRCVRDK